MPIPLLSIIAGILLNKNKIRNKKNIICGVIIGFIYCYKVSEESKTILKQSTPILLLCSLLGGTAGGILNSSVETLLTNPSLLTLLPLFSESGSLISILGARLSSGLHSGLIEPFKKPEGDSINNFIVSLVLAIIVFPIIGLLAEGSSYIFNSVGVGFDKILMISTLSGVILVVIMMIIGGKFLNKRKLYK